MLVTHQMSHNGYHMQTTQTLFLALLWTFCHPLDWKRSPARGRAQVGQAVSHDLRVSGPSTFVPGLSLPYLQ